MKRAVASALVLIGVLGVCFWLMARDLGEPFENGIHGGNAAFYSLVARNFQRYPVARLAGVMCIESGALVDEPAIYTHHPPMIGWLVWLCFALCGEGERQARSVALCLALLAVVALFALLRVALPRSPLAWLSGTLLAGASPVWAYYATMPDPQGSGVMLAMFLAIAAYLRFLREPCARHLVVMHASLVFGYLFDWPMFLVAGGLALFAWCHRRGGSRVALGHLAGSALACGVLLVSWLVLARVGPLPSLGEAFVSRTAAGLSEFSLPVAMRMIGQLHARVFSLPTSLAGAIAAVALGVGLVRRATDSTHALLLVPLGVGVAHVLLFTEGAAIHDYWQIYLAPGLSLPIAWAVARLMPIARARMPVAAGVVVLAVATCLAAHRHPSHASESDRAEGAEVKALGELLRDKVAGDGYVLVSMARNLSLAYYSDRKFFWHIEPSRIAALWPSIGGQVRAIVYHSDEVFPGASDLVRLGWMGPFASGRYRVWTRAS